MVKRILAIMLALIFLFSFVSCETKKEDDDFSRSMNVYSSYSSSTYGPIRTKNYDAYVALIPRIKDDGSEKVKIQYSEFGSITAFTGKIYDSFVTYEDISIVGQFVGIGTMSFALDQSALSGENYVAYILQDNLLFKVELHIIHTGQEGLGEEERTLYGLSRLDPSCVTPDSKMRTLLWGYTGGFVDVEGVRYIYTHGKLQGIKWVHAGFEFILREFEDYPADRTETFIGKLLDPTLVTGAVSLFNQQFDARREAWQ